MKVLHIAQMVKGGPASYLQEVMPYQSERLGVANVLLMAPAQEWKFLGWMDPASFRPAGSKRRTVRTLASFYWRAWRTIRRERPDIIHLHSSFAGVLRLAFLLWPWNRPAIVYCAHGWAFNMQVSRRRKRFYAVVERVLARVSDAIICISGFEHDQARRWGLPERILFRIDNGIGDQPVLRPAPSGSFDPAVLNLLFVGRQDRQKGFDLLVEAMRTLKALPITLHAVGEAVVSREGKWTDLPNIVQHGWKSRAEVTSLMAQADALVMPSRWEGFGLVAVEAMRQELPVCASAVDALPELVREGVSGYLFPSGDGAALARLLAGLDRSDLRRMGSGARRWFLQNFTADRMNRALLDLYQRLALAGRQGFTDASPAGRAMPDPRLPNH